MSTVYELAPRFRALFTGLDSAFGTGDRPGRWIKRPPRSEDFVKHLQGEGPGIGIAPLMPDNTVRFAAIDIDKPDFDLAKEMQRFIPGASWIERTRSGNAHVWVFFDGSVAAWVAMGVLKEVCTAAGEPHTEVFPKNHDFARVELGNYINLPYHGENRPILHGESSNTVTYKLEAWLDLAEASLNSPRAWERRADMLMIEDPATRRGSGTPFGEQANLHMCASYIIEHAEDNPLTYGHQSNTMFLLAKQLTNWRLCDHDEALEFMRYVNKHANPGLPDAEVQRILRNAEEKQYTSLGCDDPVVAPYVHPNCPIAHPRR